jgi:hypothetical protein
MVLAFTFFSFESCGIIRLLFIKVFSGDFLISLSMILQSWNGLENGFAFLAFTCRLKSAVPCEINDGVNFQKSKK